MSLQDFIDARTQKNPAGYSMMDVIAAHKKAGTASKAAKFYDAPAPTSTVKLSDKLAAAKPVEPAEESFFTRTSDSWRALRNNEFTVGDVVKEMPGAFADTVDGVTGFVAPALNKFFKTTGSIFGEGLAYAIDPTVREQYKAGNLDILPTITKMTVPKLAKYTMAAGLETAIFRSIPNVAKLKLTQLGGVGALEGVGFAISEGMAKDETPEEILKKMPLYGVSGAAMAVLTPFMIPLLRTEVTHMPGQLRNMFKKVEQDIVETETRKLSVFSEKSIPTAVPVSTPNKRYHAYLRSQGYEPYIPDEQLPVIQGGPKVDKSRDLPNVPEGRVEPVIKTKDLEPPKVSSPKTAVEVEEDYLRSQGYEPYIPDAELPVIQTQGRSPKGTVAPKPPAVPKSTEPKTEYVYDVAQPQKAQADIVASKPKTVSIKAEDGTTKTYVKSAPATSVTPEVVKGDTVAVPASQLPVGEGATAVSRLEERMVRASDTPEANRLQGEKRATYQQMTKADQMKKAATYVTENPEEAMAVLRGEKAAPDGILDNAIALALSKQADATGDRQLAVRLASLRSTRAGQEISLLTEADPDSIVSVLETIIKARKERAIRTTKKGTSVTKEVEATKKSAESALSKAQLKVADAEKLIDDILC